MANEQTSVPLYAASEVLTAANMNISAGTGVPVFATTVTRDAAFGGASEKVLAEGQLCYLSSTNVVQYYDGAAWATLGPATPSALTLISATTIGTGVSSVTVSNAFSATYDNYKIILTGGVSNTRQTITMSLGATATGYYRFLILGVYGGSTLTVASDANISSWASCFISSGTTGNNNGYLEISDPFNAKKTSAHNVVQQPLTDGNVYFQWMLLDNTTSYTAFTLTPVSSTLTGGTIRVYGYANS